MSGLWDPGNSLGPREQSSEEPGLGGAGKSFLKLQPVFTDHGSCVGRIPASPVQVSGFPEFCQAEVEERINMEKLPGSSAFLKDFYRKENMIF